MPHSFTWPQELSHLCPHAQLDISRSHSPRIYDAISSLSDCLENSKTCRECQVLLHLIEDFVPGWADARNKERCMIRLTHDRPNNRHYGTPPIVELFIDQLEEGSLWKRWQRRNPVGEFQLLRKTRSDPLFEAPSEPSYWKRDTKFPQCLEIVPDSGSCAAFERAAAWLSHCIEHDEQCVPPASAFVPQRLIEVGSEEAQDPKLVDLKDPTQYACLSYCWGPDVQDVRKTTQANLASHYAAIPYKALPKTIQDAIRVCRGLKIRYLWVDSLCIVQDDRLEWAHQCGQMRDIYRYSQLTIAALEPSSCKVGFLGKQNYGIPGWQRRADVSTEDSDQIFIRKNDLHPEELKQTPSLDHRGWCLQESLLPNRRLCFDGNEMSWECLCRRICECGHTQWVNRSTRKSRLVPIFHDEPHKAWRRLVTQYSSRNLTNKTDKLKALSGLVQTMLAARECSSDTYLAGLWKSQFLYDLTWRVEHTDLNFKRRNFDKQDQSYIAPSWSWAATEGIIHFDRKCYEDTFTKHSPSVDCSIEEVYCKNVLPDDPTGHIAAAHAILTGPVVPVELSTLSDALARTEKRKDYWDPTDKTPKAFVRSVSLHPVEVFLDRPDLSVLQQGDRQAACWQEGKCNTGCCNEETPSRLPETGLHCLRLFSCDVTTDTDTSYRHHEIWFLLLKKMPQQISKYERVGVGRCQRQRGDAVLFDGAKIMTVTIE